MNRSTRVHVVLLRGADFPGLDEVLAWSDLASRLQKLGDAMHVEGHEKLPGFDGFAWRRPTDPLPGGADDLVVLVEDAQIFLDVARARSFVERWVATGRDYGTQWEHARLPVGVGVRVARRAALDAVPAEGLAARFDRLAREADSAFYDPHPHVPHESSLLDARARPGLDEALIAEGVERFDLEGFLAFSRGREGELRFRGGAREAACVDARGLAARYGFESRACAEFPTYVMFDMTNVCNARCTHCPHGIPEMRDAMLGNATRIDEDLFRQVIDECAGRELDFVRITADGEPLLHKGLFELIAYAKERDVGPIGLTTNASLLDERRARQLLESGCDMVDISLDAVHEETYRVVRVGLRHDRVYANIHRLLEMREAIGSPLKVIVSFVEQDSNRKEVQDFRDYWEPKVDQVVVREMISNVNLNAVDRNDRVAATDRWPCPHYFRRVVVNYDGWLKACPIDWTGDTKVAPLAETPIQAIWHGDHYWSHRIQHLNRMFSPDSACGPCNDWLGTPWNLGYEKMVKKLEIPRPSQAEAREEEAFDV